MTKKTVSDENFAQNFFAALVDNLATDQDKETGRGVDYNFLPFGVLVIHRAGPMNKKYQDLVRKRYEEHNRQVDDETSIKILAEVYAKTVVIGLKTPDGKTVPYGAAEQNMMAETLARSDMMDVFTDLQSAAQNAANFRKERMKADAKNSVKS